jgi:hypothetical protein
MTEGEYRQLRKRREETEDLSNKKCGQIPWPVRCAEVKPTESNHVPSLHQKPLSMLIWF